MNLASLLASGGRSLDVPLVLLLIKATTILLAALGITLLMQRASAGARHLVWLVTLGALLLIPALTAWGPLRLEVLPAAEPAVPAVPVSPDVPATPTQAVITNGSATIIASGAGSAASRASLSPAVSTSASPHAGLAASIRNASVWSIALGLWAVVALAIVVSLAWSALVVRGLVRRSEPLDDQSWLTPLYEVSDRLGLDEPPRLLMSRDAKMPFACGLATPTIVLPPSARAGATSAGSPCCCTSWPTCAGATCWATRWADSSARSTGSTRSRGPQRVSCAPRASERATTWRSRAGRAPPTTRSTCSTS